MSAFDAVIFDYDGTLFDTRSAIAHCMRRAFEECGRPLPAGEQIVAAVKSGLPLQDTLIAIDPALRIHPAAVNGMVDVYRRLYLDEGTPLLQPFAGAADALRMLHAGGTKCAVVSNKGIAAVRRSLDENELSAFIEVIFGDAPGLPKKPDPAILTEHILPRFRRIETERILIVGDTEVDILFAKRSGAPACWASYGYGDVERCRRLEPEHEIASMSALPALVQAPNAISRKTISH
jgi:phosphoglycolate phosphatase